MVKYLLTASLLLLSFSISLFAQTGEVTDSTLQALLTQRDDIKQQMAQANEARDNDKYNELKLIWDELEAKITARQELIENSKKEAKRYLDEASSFRRDKNYPKAQSSYEKVLSYSEFINDQNVIIDVKCKIAYCLEKQKQYSAAAAAYQEVIDLDPANSNAYAGKGRVVANMDNHSEAINYFKKALEINPQDVQSYFFMAKSYEAIEMYSEAENSYSQAVQINPNYDKALYQLGVVRFKQNNYEGAIEALIATTKVDNKHYKAYTLLAQVYNAVGKYSEALDAAESAINIKPNYAQAHFEKGVALFKTARYNQAIKSFENCMQDRNWQRQAQWHIDLIKEKYLQQ